MPSIISLLREQFIAVLGHDLRNLLAALDAGIRMIREREALSERGTMIPAEMGKSVSRGNALVGNVLDFARGRLGDGLTLVRNAEQPLTPVLEHVVAAIRTIAPGRQIITDFALDEPIDCDRDRIAQLVPISSRMRLPTARLASRSGLKPEMRVAPSPYPLPTAVPR